ncbi:MAG: copper homeostasis protein CutC [Cyclobacteriaceae bacterium]|nr:copper homeostasis protein CutC [Cyclobacteriaceae bacterium]
MIIEVVVYNIESAFKAQEGGADRIELCDNPGEGGTTPSLGTVEVVRANTTMDLYVMLRPRGGDFHYSSYEFHTMKRDLIQCQKISVDGFVFGILNSDGTIDKKRCKELIDKAKPLKATCHRAFDMTRDPFEALEDCIEAGFSRILTSGQHPKAHQGIDLIRQLVEKAGNRISIMAGSGVNEETVKDIVTKTAVKEIHFSASSNRSSAMSFKNEKISAMGDEGSDEYQVRTVDPERVKKIRQIAERKE